ncbi:HIT domain-containing protein [Boletus reticuloceps]|uniref:HIT domain-containing protein n=1 Tax=Boletus reticuloceps TaxID=495285 RepID=A0A8I2YUC1_9AGAM|nr:HIT domain-containing protein [Boletus reticuloceps]
MHELPDEYLADALPIAKKIALAQGLENYNILQVCPHLFLSIRCVITYMPHLVQNNGRIAHQQVDHVHFHVIPKPNETEGLVLNESCWPAKTASMEELKTYHAELTAKLEGMGKL